MNPFIIVELPWVTYHWLYGSAELRGGNEVTTQKSHGFWGIWIVFNIFMAAAFGVQTLSMSPSYEAFAIILWAKLSWTPKGFGNFGLYGPNLRCLGSLGPVKLSIFFIKVLKSMAGIRIKTCSNWNPLCHRFEFQPLKYNHLNLLAQNWFINLVTIPFCTNKVDETFVDAFGISIKIYVLGWVVDYTLPLCQKCSHHVYVSFSSSASLVENLDGPAPDSALAASRVDRVARMRSRHKSCLSQWALCGRLHRKEWLWL